MPNITGTWAAAKLTEGMPSVSGALYNSAQNSNWTEKGYNSSAVGIGFNASLSNSIYGASTTVQPPALTMRYYIKY